MIFFFNADDEDDTVIVNSEEWEVRKSDEICDTLKIEATNEASIFYFSYFLFCFILFCF